MMQLPEIPYTPDMYRNASKPVRVWYSLNRVQIRELQQALADFRTEAKKPDVDEVALEADFVAIFCKYVGSVEIDGVMHMFSADKEAALEMAGGLSFKFITQALAGMAAELYDSDFVKK